MLLPFVHECKTNMAIPWLVVVPRRRKKSWPSIRRPTVEDARHAAAGEAALRGSGRHGGGREPRRVLAGSGRRGGPSGGPKPTRAALARGPPPLAVVG